MTTLITLICLVAITIGIYKALKAYAASKLPPPPGAPVTPDVK